MMRIFESHLIGNFTHGLGRIGKTFLNFIDNGELNTLEPIYLFPSLSDLRNNWKD